MSIAVSHIAASAPPVRTGASMRMPPSQKMTNLFNKIDTAGTGSISKSQFEQAFQSLNPPAAFKKQGADAIWAKLDPNGNGNVSKSDFISTMTSLMSQSRQPTGSATTSAAPVVAPTATVNASLYALNGLGQSANTSGTTLNTSA